LANFDCAEKIGIGQMTYIMCGTPEYMSPERVAGSHGHDTTADLWTLGVFICELVCGHSPFANDNPIHAYANILRGIDTFPFPSSTSITAIALIKALCR
jgi:serine/threonine protein kinase